MNLTKMEQAVLNVLTRETRTPGHISFRVNHVHNDDTMPVIDALKALYRKGLAEPNHPGSWWWRITSAGIKEQSQ